MICIYANFIYDLIHDIMLYKAMYIWSTIVCKGTDQASLTDQRALKTPVELGSWISTKPKVFEDAPPQNNCPCPDFSVCLRARAFPIDHFQKDWLTTGAFFVVPKMELCCLRTWAFWLLYACGSYQEVLIRISKFQQSNLQANRAREHMCLLPTYSS
jgi:hypothetical protein